MTQPLITALCPNCSTDASKHNKVLYDGIFLICHNCGYGWYYNIEIFSSKKVSHYNAASTIPLNTLQQPSKIRSHGQNKPQSQRKLKADKQNRTPSNHSGGSHNHHSHSKPANHLANATQAENRHNKIPTSSNKTSNYNSNTNYSDNFYYEAPENNTPHTKRNNPNTNKFDTAVNYSVITPISSTEVKNHNQTSTSTTNNKINTNIINSANPTVSNTAKKDSSIMANEADKDKATNHSTQKTTDSNKTQKQIIINPKTINNKNSSNIKINLNNLPTASSIEKSNKLDNVTKDNHAKNNYNEDTNNLISPAILKENTTPEENETIVNEKSNHNIEFNNNDNINESINKQPQEQIPINNNDEPEAGETNLKTNINLENNFSFKDNSEDDKSIDSAIILEKSSNDNNTKVFGNQLHFSDTMGLNSLSNNPAINEFNFSLHKKENLGLDSASLLKIEEQEQYNIKNYQKPLLEFKNLVPDIKSLNSQIKQTFIALLKAIITVVTRPDLILRGLAYAIIIVSVVAFLIYSNNAKRRAAKQSNIENSAYNSDFSSEAAQNLKDKDNLALSGVRPLEEPTEKNSLNASSSSISKDKDEDKIVAFQKQHKKNSSQTNITGEANSKPNNKVTFIESLQAKVKSSFLTLKQMQQNSFSKVKIYQNSSYWQGAHNDALMSSTTLFNEDSTNSYLIRSLEVVFLGKNGETLGKRIIISNQLISNNSAINLNLKINNPPLDTNKTFVFIKDKSKL